MPPEELNNLEPILEAQTLQNEEIKANGEETNSLLQALIAQGESDNDSLIEAQIAQADQHNKELKEAIKESNKNTLNLELDGVSLATIKGETGEKGDKGDKGDTGPQGESIRGEKGDTGEQGPAGLDGRDGVDGIGIKGDKGDKGDRGTDGKDGLDGVDGKNGSEDTPKQIKKKLESLKDDDRLDVKAIKGIKDFQKQLDRVAGFASQGQEYRISGTKIANNSGVLNFVAGSGATITGVPTSDGATITIGASGGGSVETVTGLNVDNTDPANPIMRISVDGVTVTGAGTPASPLVAVGDGTGDVHGPASSTDNAIARFDSTTGKIIQNSGITIADGATGTLSGTNTGDQDLSGLVPYTGATGDVTLGVHGLTLHDIKGDASDGLLIEANNGTDIAILGAGNTANGTWYGSHNIEGTQVAIGKNATTIGKLKLYGNTSGDVTIQPNAVAGTGVVLTAPATTGTLAITSDITGTNSGTNTGDQTITNSSDATSHTVTLSASGGSVQLIEGSNITLTTGGTGSAGTVTIAATAGGTGDVVGPASATDNAIARFDSTTGKLIQNSAATIADTTGDITAGKYNTVAISGASTPTLAVTGTSSISGANTGDQTSVSGNAGTATALATARTIGTLTGDVTSTGSSFDGTGNNTNSTTVTKINGTSLAGLATGILKNTTATGVPSIAIAGDFPTLNQNTTGSAATLTTPRAIYGNNFDGSAALTQVIASTYGGTGNGFTKFSGPTTAEKTFTLPDASATIARTDAAQTFTGVQTFSTPIATGSVATMTATVGGGVPTPPNNTTTFLRGDGTFAAPAAGALTYKNGTATRVGNTSSGTQNIAHGLGATPSKVRITARAPSTSTVVTTSDGVYNGTTNSCVYFAASQNIGGIDNTNGIHIEGTGSSADSQKAVITCDGTNIILTWTKAGSPLSGDINMMWEVE